MTNRIVTIQDISCVGKCSLTVALPIISAMGVEAAVIPTAVLSTHTAFKGFTFRDLTNDINDIAKHWKKEKIDFKAIYTGYLGSFEQLNIVSGFIDDFKKDDTIVFIDPVMADNGKLYPGFSEDFAKQMAKLCKKADVIVPNITEACFMTGTQYKEKYDKEYILSLIKNLSDLGCKTVVLTGVSFEEGKVGVMSYNKDKDEYFSYFREKIPVLYHGTGDVFSSTCVGAIARGKSLEEALKIATDYTVECIKTTFEDKDSNWYGVNFEECMPFLVNEINK